MSHQSEERLPESGSAGPEVVPSARVIQLKTRQSDLQRAIQLRAQESVERERHFDVEHRRPKPLKWLIISAIAAIPAVLTLTAVDSFLRVFHTYMDVAVASQPQDEPAPAGDAEMIDPNATLQSNEPGVVLLQPLRMPAAAQDTPLKSTPPAEPAPR